MIRLVMGMLIAVLMAPQPVRAACSGSTETKLPFSAAGKSDTFVVESFGDRCTDARIVIYVKTDGGRWAALLIGQLTDFGSEPKSPAELQAALKEVAGRIEGPMMSRLETWAEIRRAATQPEGNPWRGTPLVQAEYERLLKAKPRFVYIPTDAIRAKLVVWDEHGYGGRPVDFVYYGD